MQHRPPGGSYSVAKGSGRGANGLRTSGDGRSFCGVGRGDPERSARTLPSVPDNLPGLAEEFRPDSCPTRGFLREAGSMPKTGADMAEGVVTVVSPQVILAEEVSVCCI